MLFGLTRLFYPWGLILQAIAVVHFIRRRPDGYWLWVILVGGGLGAVVYMVAEMAPDAQLLRGIVDKGARRRRIDELEATIRINPAIGNQEELADLCLDDGRFARARELYDHVIAAQPAEIDPYYRRGLAALSLGDTAAARADLDRVVSKDRKYDIYRAIGMLAHAEALTGDAVKADAHFKEATEISTLSETYFNYASFLAAAGRTSEAKDWAGRILAKKAAMPRYLRRRERPWFRKATALVKRIDAGPR
jgi:hypothetical protein